MAMVPVDHASMFAAFSKGIVDPKTLSEDGVEDEPHVTVLYGFKPDFDAKQLQAFCQPFLPIHFTIGKLSRFECPDYDVIKFDIVSPELESLNEKLAEKFKDKIVPSEYDYHPHLTVAYVQKGTNENISGSYLTGTKLAVNSLLYSMPEKAGRTSIKARRAVSQHPLEAAAGPLPGQIERVIVSLQNDGRLPIRIPPDTMRHVAESLARYFSTASADKIDQFAEAAKAAVEAELKTENVQTHDTMKADTTGVNVGATPATSRGVLTSFIESATGDNIGGLMNMDFFNRIMREVTQGAGNFVAQNFDQTRLDEFPALELHRVYDREVPRGFKVGAKGAIVPDPDNDWPSRWEAAGGELVDGRMVALKSDPIWQALGDGDGGYEDTLGNPFAPFAFNSGFDTDEVSREDAVALGLMDDEDEAKPADFDFKSLLNIEAASAAVRSPLQAAAGDVPLVVKCFITDADGRLLVLQADGYGRMDLPGGHLRAGETVEAGLRREVLEETGMTLVDVKELGTVLVPWNGQQPIVFFSAQSDGSPVLSDEHVDFFWLNKHEVALRNFSALNKVVNNFTDGKDLNTL